MPLNVSHRLMSFLLLGVLAWACWGCSRQPADMTPQAVAANPATPGQALFEENCAGCHGLDGGGPGIMSQGRAVQFNSPGWQKTHTDAYIQKTIREGKGMMPAFETTLSDEELKQLTQYVRSLASAK